MIYITGDTHIPIDIEKLNESKFPQQNSMTKNDYVVICGDFGGVWNNSDEELQWREYLKQKNFTSLFIDGNHENFNLLNQYEVSIWNGGKVHFINDSIIHLMRGQVFTIDGLKFFTMGGGESIDKDVRIKGKTWWSEEIPNSSEYEEALSNLDKTNWCVDYIITHTSSMALMKKLDYIKENNSLNQFLDTVQNKLHYKHWYFGHFHDDIDLDEKHTMLFEKIIRMW